MPFVPDQTPQAAGRFVPDVPAGQGSTGSWGRGASGEWQNPEIAAMSNLDKYRAGAKVAGTGLMMGVKQRLDMGVTPEQVDSFRASNKDLMEDPVANAGATTANVAMATVPMLVPGANTVIGSALAGGAFGAAQPTGSGESAWKNAAIGAGTSAGVTAGIGAIGRAVQPVRNANNSAEQAAVNLLKQNGVDLSVGAKTGSKSVVGAERMLGNNPITQPQMLARAAKTERSMTRAFLKTAGINSDTASPAVLNSADTRIGNGMNVINKRYRLDMTDPKISADLAAIESEAKLNVPDSRIGNWVEKIREMAGPSGQLSAEAAQNIRNGLGKLVRDSTAGEYAYALRELMDDALQTAAKGTDDFAKLTALRGEYRNLQALADAADTTANAQISGPKLASALSHSRFTKNSFRYGTGDTKLTDLARAASTVKDRFPNSGTAYHAAAQLVPSAVVGGASYLSDQDVGKAAKLAAATYAIPKSAAFMLNNPAMARYLSEGLVSGPGVNALTGYAKKIAAPVATGLVLSK
jgi:hypothetical protein